MLNGIIRYAMVSIKPTMPANGFNLGHSVYSIIASIASKIELNIIGGAKKSVYRNGKIINIADTILSDKLFNLKLLYVYGIII